MASSTHKLLLLLLYINALSENVMCVDSEDSHGIDVKEEEVEGEIKQGPSFDVKENLETHDVSPQYHSFPMFYLSKEEDEVIKGTNEESSPLHHFTENNKKPRNLEVPMNKGTVNNPDNASPSEDAKVPIEDTPNDGESFKDSNVDHEHSKSTEYKIPLETLKFDSCIVTDDKQIPYYTKVILDQILESFKESVNNPKPLVDKEPSREDVVGDQNHPIVTEGAGINADATVEEQQKEIVSHVITEKGDYQHSGNGVLLVKEDTSESDTKEASDHVKRDTSHHKLEEPADKTRLTSGTEYFGSHNENSEEISKMLEELGMFLQSMASAHPHEPKK